MRVPAIGPCMQASALSRFCLALRLTLDSSMSTAKALRMSLRATGNGAFEAQADKIGEARGKKGDELAKVIGTNAIFPVRVHCHSECWRGKRSDP